MVGLIDYDAIAGQQLETGPESVTVPLGATPIYLITGAAAP